MRAASSPAERITSVMKGCTSFVLLVSGNVLIAEGSTALLAIQRDAPGARIKTLPNSVTVRKVFLFCAAI